MPVAVQNRQVCRHAKFQMTAVQNIENPRKTYYRHEALKFRVPMVSFIIENYKVTSGKFENFFPVVGSRPRQYYGHKSIQSAWYVPRD